MKSPYKYFILCWLALLSTFSIGQITYVDTLEYQLKQTNNVEEQIKILTDIYSEYNLTNPRKALGSAKEIYEITLVNSPNEILFALNIMGSAYLNIEQNDSALMYYQKGLELAIDESDSLYLSKFYTNLGVVQFNIDEYEKGLDYMKQSAEIDRLMGNWEFASLSYINLGAIYMQLDDFEMARLFFKNAIEISSFSNDELNLADSYSNLGILEYREGNFKDARDYFFLSLDVYHRISDYDGVSRVYRGIAVSFQKENEFEKAIAYDLKALEYALKIDNAQNIRKAYRGLANSYEETGNYKLAFENQKEYTAWKDSSTTRLNKNKLLEIQRKYDLEKSDKENEILIQQSQIKDLKLIKNNQELTKSNIIIWSSILGLVLLVVLAFTLYNKNLIRKKANDQLQEAHDIINEKNQDITASIEYASKIQEALFSTQNNIEMFSDSFIMLKPKDIVSGDFYWYSEVDNKKIITAVDCTGHGVPGAFMSMIGNTFLHEIVNVNGITRPGKILDELRKRVISAMDNNGMEGSRRDGMDMSLCMIDEEAMVMEFAGANNPVYVLQNDEIVEIKGDKKPVGYMPERPEDFTNHLIKINKGDVIYLFSDGYADQFGGVKGKKFKYKNLRNLLIDNSKLAMKDQKIILDRTFEDWKGSLEQIDDVCVIGLRI